jgi:hypothetical protein
MGHSADRTETPSRAVGLFVPASLSDGAYFAALEMAESIQDRKRPTG